MHEVAQLELLGKLLAQKSAADSAFVAPDVGAMDRKARNKLEKTLRRQLGLPKSDPRDAPDAQSTTTAGAAGGARSSSVKQRAVEHDARTCARLAAMLDAGLLPAKIADDAAKLSSRGRNPFSDAARVATSAMAAAAAAAGTSADAAADAASAPDLSPLTAAELAWAKAILKETRRAAKASQEAEQLARRIGRKRADVAERYRLPPELHIPQELILSNPVANARRVEKESKLFKYKRNAPNYAELVAKVRKEFLDALPTALGAGSTSGVDGNAQSVRSGWDANTTLTAVFEDEPPEQPQEKKDKEEVAAADEEEDGPPRKKSKQETKSGAVVVAATAAAAAPVGRLHESYRPRFVSSFSWLPERDSLRKASVDHLDPSSVLAYTASRMVQPGAPYAYLQPPLPLVFRPNLKGFEVDKPGIVALIMAARVAGVTFEESSGSSSGSAAAPAVAAAEADESASAKVKKEKKKRKKNPATDAAAFTVPPGSPNSSEPRIRFVSYRNNFRKFFNRRDAWRVDIQRVGRSIFLRRHLNYNYVNPFDVGHLFEQACKESNVLQAVAASHGIGAAKAALKAHGRKEDSTTHPYRAVVAAELNEFDLLTSIEIDLYQKHNATAAAAASAAEASPASAADAASSSGPSYTVPSGVSFPANPLDCFLELKTVKKQRWDKAKKSDVWVQTFLGGVTKTIVGYKQEHREANPREAKLARKRARAEAHRRGEEYVEEKRKGKVSQKAHMGAAALAAKEGADQPVEISEIHEARTSLLIDHHTKEQLMRRFYSLLRFLAQHVQEGKVYKLEHRRKEAVQTPAAPGKPFVHPSRAQANGDSTAAAAAAPTVPHVPHWRQTPLMQHASHSANWTIVLEEIDGAMETQPVLAPTMLTHVDRWAEQYKQEQEKRAAIAADIAANGSAQPHSHDESMSDVDDAKDKKKKKTIKSEKKSSDKSGSSKKKRKQEEAEEDNAAAADTTSDDKKKEKKKEKKSSSKSDKKKSSKKAKKEVKSESATGADSSDEE